MGLFDRTSLPPRLLDPANWKGTDDDTWWMRWRIKRKHWFAFSDLSPKGLALSFVMFPLIWFTIPLLIIPVLRKWRSIPIVLFGVKSDEGSWRFEKNKAEDKWDNRTTPREFLKENPGYYLSRIQPWTRAHFALHWPLMISWNVYWRESDVQKPGEKKDVDGKVFSGYKGFHYDRDGIFWGDGAAAGNFK